MDDDLLLAPATRQLAALRAGTVTSRELVEATLERIGRHDAVLRAFALVDEDGARRAADACDAARRRTPRLGPLHGLPVAVKDAWATEGLRTAAGSAARAGVVPARDAPVVARLRAAGAIVLGKTNVPEDVTGQETANQLVGRTCNPWDTTRTTGGSSGGAAAAVATGMAALDVGSDKGGSIRQPAAYCGVYGHVATRGTVPLRGHLPSVAVDDVHPTADLVGAGPLARSAGDLALALDVLAGPDPLGRPGWSLALPPARAERVEDLRVAVWADDAALPVSDAVRLAIDEAATALEDAGAAVDRRARPELDPAGAERLAFALWVADASSDLDEEELARLRKEVDAAVPDDRSRRAARARAATMPHARWLQLDARRRALQRSWAAFFGDVDVLLCPVVPTTAPHHDPDVDGIASLDHRLARTIDVDGRARPYLDQMSWSILTGSVELPATAVPLGLGPDGLPVGAQLVGPSHGDRTTIAAAGFLERLVGRQPHPPLTA